MAVGEWDQRQLCPDGACIGVIGPEGTCKVCGRAAPNWGDERNRGLIHPDDDEDDDDDALAAREEGDDEEGDDDEDDDDEDNDDDGDEDGDDEDDGDEDDDDEAPEPEAAIAPRGEWSARALCPDGGCVGVIGPDGRCKVCGRRASRGPVEPASEPASTPAVEPAAPVAAAATAEPAASDQEPCSTPGCAGHIGADGRCAVCGKGAS